LCVIDTKSLAESYGGAEAVGDVSLRVERGGVFGFLGPNGAGKTTTVRMLATLTRPSNGEASVVGFDLQNQGPAIRSRIGVVLRGESYEYSKTVEQALELYGMLWDIPRSTRSDRIEHLIDEFGLT
jgi:ABC-2 type transport system ATP-binding protein